jgi:colicin import membrane protein
MGLLGLGTSRRDEEQDSGGREPPPEAGTRKRGHIRCFAAWLGFGPETDLAERAEESRRRAERAARRARKKAERRTARLTNRAVREESVRLRAAEREAALLAQERADAERRTRREAAIDERIRVAEAAVADAAERVAAEEIVALEQDLGHAALEAAARLDELETLLTSTAPETSPGVNGAEDARAQLVGAEERTARARREADEARRSVGAISSRQADVEAERRLYEEAERRFEAEWVELRDNIDMLQKGAADDGEERFAAELRRRADRLERERAERDLAMERAERLMSEIEERALASAERLTGAERELALQTERLRVEEEWQAALETERATEAMEAELEEVRRKLADAQGRALVAERRVQELELELTGRRDGEREDPLEALEASLREGSSDGEAAQARGRRRRRDGFGSLGELEPPPGFAKPPPREIGDRSAL